MKLFGVLLAGIVICVSHPHAQNNDEYTKEQLLVFGTKHLSNIDSKASLLYQFKQDGTQAKKLEDTIALNVSSIHPDASKTLQVKFLSGKDERQFPKLEKFNSNPMIMYFLQWDVEKMSAETETNWRHFQRVIRFGFREAQSEEVSVAYNSKPYKGYRVFFTPLKDENANKYGKYLSKHYEFTFSDDIPGGVYSIKTWIPDTGNKTDIERTEITFKELKPLLSQGTQ